MCEPVTIAAVGASLIAGGVKAASGYAAAQENANTLDANARRADEASTDAILRGRYAEGRARMEGSLLAAKQQTAFSANGIDTQSGSALDVLSDTKMYSELDAQMLKFNAGSEAHGYKDQAGQFRKQAKYARDAAGWDAAGSVLGSVVGAASYAAPMIKIGT